MPFRRCVAILGTLFLLSASVVCAADAKPTILRTPNRGIQPQAVMDAKGVLHLLYFKGAEAFAGDLFYVRREPGKDAFTEPIRVNSQEGSAVAAGSIRGGQIALGKNGRVHVVWNGSTKATPKSFNNGFPMLYSRLDEKGRAFEPQRNLMQQSYMLDGGGTVTADARGNVYVAWHGLQVGAMAGELNRKVWVTKSSNDGKTFSKEEPATAQPTGACGCCGMRGFVDSKGAVQLLYRSASGGTRDMYLLTSNDQARSFQDRFVSVQKWSINSCPMSSQTFAEGPDRVIAAWQTEEQVYFASLKPGSNEPEPPQAAPGSGPKRKHPAVAVNGKGAMLLAWTEGTEWNKGGALVWQMYDAAGKPTADQGRIDGGIPVWGLPTVVATPEGGFLIIH
jgi:hypothetical protein